MLGPTEKAGRKERRKEHQVNEYILKFKLETTILISPYPGALHRTRINMSVEKN